MGTRSPEHTIYLDLDGVIFPTWHKSDGGYVQTEEGEPLRLRSELQKGIHPRWIDRSEFYYPAITRRLGELAAHGARIMPSSSRSFDLLLSYPSVAEDLGGVDRYLVIDTFAPNNSTYKARAVLNNWQGVVDLSSEQRGWERLRSMATTHPLAKPLGSRAVWIDDAATPRQLDESLSPGVEEIFQNPSLKVISPLNTTGVTMAQLDEVETFLFEEA